mmetsp:Transcript_17331/g.31538  ORF Transcript_17331/g.31538 Transcript_17331/m.31538 type:complete len:148 (-) Transcript_17331:106-549(-)|eukprot:CAMPEP_0205905888 /NCGR_PEP_ID=MMETSP1325-20131115/1617_1 /ASSEMBLY_ACC=CAM_ASM_000708 /TAXON_ID=236786 /ORGANISM="Florenciella sp., Strain RCC1007" /LENGTH=147 /DNA_ID=CAMNT_0053271843 /DNA_START=97 /DNA_END=540 /DNA_ORIENTATION=-
MSAVAMFATTVPQADLHDASNWDPSHLFDQSLLQHEPLPSKTCETAFISSNLRPRNTWERKQEQENIRRREEKLTNARFISAYPLDDMRAMLQYTPGSATSSPRDRHCKAEQRRLLAMCSEHAHAENADDCKRYAYNFLAAQGRLLS